MSEQKLFPLDAVYSRLSALAELSCPDGGPAFLFRGERELFPTTVSDDLARRCRGETQVFEFTASPDVAVQQAANRFRHRRPWPKAGWMGVLDVAEAGRVRKAALVQLRPCPDEGRTRRRGAYELIYTGLPVGALIDLKAPRIAGALGLRWWPFTHLADDEAFLRRLGVCARASSQGGSIRPLRPWRTIVHASSNSRSS